MFFALLLSELLEELLEEMIAVGFSWIIGKVLNVLLLVALTQGTKIVIKRIIKSITYKEGNDKMEKLKNFFSTLKEKLTKNVIWSNKLTISGMASTLFMLLEGTDITNVVSSLPTLTIYGFNVMPYIIYLVLGLLAMFGVGKQGFESVKTYLERISNKEVAKEVKSQEKAKEKAIEKKTKELELKARSETKEKAKALVEAEIAKNKN